MEFLARAVLERVGEDWDPLGQQLQEPDYSAGTRLPRKSGHGQEGDYHLFIIMIIYYSPPKVPIIVYQIEREAVLEPPAGEIKKNIIVENF